MKQLLITLTVLLIGLTAQSQSFYHKKMRKVDRSAYSADCEAMKPKVTIVQSLTQKAMYQNKRKQYKAKRRKG